ncbi:MAG: DUF898 family protein [Myxococcales bacterium]
MSEVGLATLPTLQVQYRGNGWNLFKLTFVNLLLTVVTVGIYGPWARTNRRKFIWQRMYIEGTPLNYTGTGKEILIGCLKLGAAYLGLFVLPPLIVGYFSKGASRGLQFMGGLALFLLVPLAIYWSRRYLLSHTRWRDIRFGLAGDAGAFAKQFLIGFGLTVVTFGFYGPIFANRIYRTLTRNTRYGNQSFSYDGDDGEAFRIGLRGILLSLVTLGIYWPWYRAEVLRFRMSHTRFDQATGHSELTGGVLLKVALVAVFGNILSLGIAFPWIVTYALRTILGQLSLRGTIDYARISPESVSGDAMGDALGGAFSVELGM